jgi:hypothetical protein
LPRCFPRIKGPVLGDGVGAVTAPPEPSPAGWFALPPWLLGDAAGLVAGPPDEATVVGDVVGVGLCVGVPVGVVVGVAPCVGVPVGVGVALGPALLVGEVVGQPGFVGPWGNGSAEGTVNVLGLACAPERLTALEPLPAEPPALGRGAGVRHVPGLGVLPGDALPGRGPALPPPLAPGWADVGWAVTDAVVPPPGDPPLPLLPGWTTALPPLSTVELTWTSAARSGGTATAAAVIDAAAARPATMRIHPMPCGRRAVQATAARWLKAEAAVARAGLRRVQAGPWGRKATQARAAAAQALAASAVLGSEVRASAVLGNRARVALVSRIACRTAPWSRQ